MADDPHHDWLNANVSLYRRMPADLQEELRVMIPEFIGIGTSKGIYRLIATRQHEVTDSAIQ